MFIIIIHPNHKICFPSIQFRRAKALDIIDVANKYEKNYLSEIDKLLPHNRALNNTSNFHIKFTVKNDANQNYNRQHCNFNGHDFAKLNGFMPWHLIS